MSRLPAPLAAHLAGDVTTVCHCWTLIRSDGVTLSFTDHDRALTVEGVLHLPDSGFSPTEAESALGLGISTDGIEGAIAHDSITADDLRSGVWDEAKVVTRIVNWADPSQNAILRRAAIARIEEADGIWRAEIEDVSADLAVPRGRIARKRCDAELGDARCKVDLAAGGRTRGAIVQSRPSPDVLVVSGSGLPPEGRFDGGSLEFGAARLRITRHAAGPEGASLHLAEPAPPALAAGAAVTLVVGCDKRFSTCRDDFGNALNFRGFPHLPGNDAAYAYANDASTADGSPVVP